MPAWLTDILKLLGFTTPFVYAAATYGVFRWLDKKASGPAKRAMKKIAALRAHLRESFGKIAYLALPRRIELLFSP